MSAARKCFLVTGTPGVGKTTLIIRVLEAIKQLNPNLKVQGFYTREIREGAERVGFEVVTVDGRRGPLASTNNTRVAGNYVHRMHKYSVPYITEGANFKFTSSSRESLRWPNVGRFKVDVASFESLVLPEMEVKEDTDLFIVDEVGKMELYSSSFFPAVLRVLESNIPLLASVPVPKSGRDIPGVARLKNHPGAAMYMLTTSNRDVMREQIYSNLVDLLQIPLKD